MWRATPAHRPSLPAATRILARAALARCLLSEAGLLVFVGPGEVWGLAGNWSTLEARRARAGKG